MFDYQRFNLNEYNRKGFSDMYRLCFGQTVAEDYTQWKYKDNPAGEVLAFTAEENGNMAGFYGVIPESYSIGGKTCCVYQSMDTMTHPGFQKRGLFVTLAEKTYQSLLEQDPETLIIGIPGSNSYHGFVNKLQWKAIHHFSFTFVHRSVFKLLNPGSPQKKYTLAEIHDFETEPIRDFFKKLSPDPHKIQAVINPAFLKWRITRHPFTSYHSLSFSTETGIVGIVIYRVTEDQKCFIEWIESDTVETPTNILKAFCAHLFKKESFKYIYTWKPVEEKKLKGFRSLGFLSNPMSRGPFSYRVPFIVYSKTGLKNGLNVNDIHNYDLQPIIQD